LKIGDSCIEEGAKIFDIPIFVENFYKNPVPFKNLKSSKLPSIFKEFNYESELGRYKDN
jgi:hypothetical protein